MAPSCPFFSWGFFWLFSLFLSPLCIASWVGVKGGILLLLLLNFSIDRIHCKEQRNTNSLCNPLVSNLGRHYTPTSPTQPTFDCRGLECIGSRVQGLGFRVQYDHPSKILLSRRISGSYLLLGLEDLALHLRSSSSITFQPTFLLSRVQGLGFIRVFTQSLEEKPGFHVLQVLPQGEWVQVLETKKPQPGQLVARCTWGVFLVCKISTFFTTLNFTYEVQRYQFTFTNG